MSATDRRSQLLNTLMRRRQDTAENLAQEFGVSERTIRNDVLELSFTLPIETVRGRYGGGIKLADWWVPSRTSLAPEQANAIRKAAQFLEGEDRQALQSILAQFSP